MEPYTAFQISSCDNVATALTKLPPGPIRLTGETAQNTVTCAEEIPAGHKISLKFIGRGEKIIKYGVPIGCATDDIPAGRWVHLHCMKSLYDERSSHLDAVTGAPKDIRYE